MIRKVRQLQNFLDFQITGKLSQSKIAVIKRTWYGIPDVFTAAFFQMNPSGKTKQTNLDIWVIRFSFLNPKEKQGKDKTKQNKKQSSRSFYLSKLSCLLSMERVESPITMTKNRKSLDL